jgi:hypothetical protein
MSVDTLHKGDTDDDDDDDDDDKNNWYISVENFKINIVSLH